MDLFFGVVMLLIVWNTEPVDHTNHIVVVSGETQLREAIFDLNCELRSDVKIVNSLGNCGRYKNIGIEYEYIKHGEYTNQMKKAGIKACKLGGVEFLYFEKSEITPRLAEMF